MAKRKIPGTEPMPAHEAGDVDPLGQIVGGKWRLQRQLGQGGTATVYEAHSTDGEIAAIKLLHGQFAVHLQVRERFRREAIAAQSIKHPDVVRILDHGDDPLGPFIAMELLDGHPLSYWAQRGGIPLEKLLTILVRVLDVLAVAHDQRIIHRDVKPANIFLTRAGGVKVLDFGIARMFEALPDDLRTKTGIALGTLSYMAPEQARGMPNQIDARTDLFSLAATAFRMLARRPVHARRKPGELLLAMATEVAPRLAAVAPHVPREVCEVIDMGLAYAKDKRYPDARTMRADLMAVRNGRPPPYATGRLDKTQGDPETVPDHPYEAPPGWEEDGRDETLHWGTPDSAPPPIDSSPGATTVTHQEQLERTTVPFAPLPEASALEPTQDPTPAADRRMDTQPIGSFPDPDEKS
jgi:serine/threonine protein kinase